MNLDQLTRLRNLYRDGLLDDVVPFWSRHSIDREFGGFITSLDREGRIIDTDKAIWPQGRMAWLFATLYSTVEPRDEWLSFAHSGVNFLTAHGFDSDDRMFFRVTREGLPIRKRRYYFSECFTCMAFAALARATRDEILAARARTLFARIIDYTLHPNLLPAKETVHRPSQGLAIPMIVLATAQVLRETIGDPLAEAWTLRSIDLIEHFFVKDEYEAVLETVGRDGEILDHFDGRLLNPGHAIEAAWFILKEAKHRGGDPRLLRLGTKMLDWMLARGWDNEFGGMLYYRDLHDLPIQEYWHDMKFWWPHNEAIIATLLAWQLTREEKYFVWLERLNAWSYEKFADPEFGEWFGYLRRDGSISSSLKGNMWKSAFHLPRMQLVCWQILDEELAV